MEKRQLKLRETIIYSDIKSDKTGWLVDLEVTTGSDDTDTTITKATFTVSDYYTINYGNCTGTTVNYTHDNPLYINHFDVKSGTVSMDLSDPDEIAGYTFAGWYMDQAGSKRITGIESSAGNEGQGDKIEAIKDNREKEELPVIETDDGLAVDVYAKWIEGEPCKVTFKPGNGSRNTVQNVIPGNTAVRPEDPEWENHTFLGWYIENTDTEFKFNETINTNTTLVAKWTNAVTFKYGNGDPDYVVEVYDGNTVNEPQEPVRDRYNFRGWYKGAIYLISQLRYMMTQLSL